jgi:Skp family chaperone for outer membrane proteins
MKKLVLIIAAALIGLASAHAQTPKVMVVDMQFLFNNYYKAQEAQQRLQGAAQSADDELNVMRQSLEGTKVRLQEILEKANNPALTEEARKRFQDEAQKTFNEGRMMEQQMERFALEQRQRLQERGQNISQAQLKEILEVVEQVAKKKGADLVLNRGAVLYFDKSYDATEDVLKIINADQKK